jgi:hypothetical protein
MIFFNFKKGRYSAQHVYTQQQVKDIINHARLRGIRVIPEFDSPGHVAAIGRAFPSKSLVTGFNILMIIILSEINPIRYIELRSILKIKSFLSDPFWQDCLSIKKIKIVKISKF